LVITTAFMRCASYHVEMKKAAPLTGRPFSCES
jgi:hypothetical protein